MEADPASVERGIEDGDVIDPHDMDPQTVLRFVKSVNGWPGRVLVIACEPADIEEPGSASPPRSRAPSRLAVALSRETDRGAAAQVHELSIASAIVATAERHADGCQVAVVRVRVDGCARWSRTRSSSASAWWRASRSAKTRGWSSRSFPRVLRCSACEHEWEIEEPPFWCPGARAAMRRGRAARSSRSSRSRSRRGGRMHRTHVKVLEDVLDANGTIARANRADFDRARSHGRQPDGQPRRRQDDGLEQVVASLAGRARRRARGRREGHASTPTASPQARPGHADQHRPELRRRMPPRRQHGALGDPLAAARRDRPADHRERRQPRLPGRVPRRRARPRDGHVGHRGRGQAAQVPADVPRLRARAREQDRPPAAPRHRPRAVPLPPRRASTPGVEHI